MLSIVAVVVDVAHARQGVAKMCIICVGLDDNKLTPWEAARNRTEMLNLISEEHHIVIEGKIQKALKNYLNNFGKESSSDEKDS